jgi:hypothetical protein
MSRFSASFAEMSAVVAVRGGEQFAERQHGTIGPMCELLDVFTIWKRERVAQSADREVDPVRVVA